MCVIYLLLLLGRLRFLHFQLMLDCTVSNKWNEFSDLILVLRLLSTSLSDCTAWHRPGWVSSLWSWEARPGIAGGFGSGAERSKRQPRWQGSPLQYTGILQTKWKRLISSGLKTVEQEKKGHQGRMAAYQVRGEQNRVPQSEKEDTGTALVDKRCLLRFLKYLLFHAFLNLP